MNYVKYSICLSIDPAAALLRAVNMPDTPHSKRLAAGPNYGAISGRISFSETLTSANMIFSMLSAIIDARSKAKGRTHENRLSCTFQIFETSIGMDFEKNRMSGEFYGAPWDL
jgi:hypothetical protein